MLRSGDWTAASGHRIGRQLLRATSLPSAVFVANDLMALGLLKALHDANIAVPDQVSVVGFDDMPGSDFFEPRLTTVRQELDSLGRLCIDILLSALGGTPTPRPVVPATLVVRESSGPPPA